MASKLLVRCTYVNRDKDAVFGEDPDFLETFTDDRGELFRDCLREYGRCIGTVRDEHDGDRPCGWIFLKRDRYSDTGRRGRKAETYLREVWVCVKEARDAVSN